MIHHPAHRQGWHPSHRSEGSGMPFSYSPPHSPSTPEASRQGYGINTTAAHPPWRVEQAIQPLAIRAAKTLGQIAVGSGRRPSPRAPQFSRPIRDSFISNGIPKHPAWQHIATDINFRQLPPRRPLCASAQSSREQIHFPPCEHSPCHLGFVDAGKNPQEQPAARPHFARSALRPMTSPTHS